MMSTDKTSFNEESNFIQQNLDSIEKLKNKIKTEQDYKTIQTYKQKIDELRSQNWKYQTNNSRR